MSCFLPLEHTTVQDSEPGTDPAEANELEGLQALAEDEHAQEDGAHRDEEGHQQQVGGPRRLKDAEVDNVGEGGGEQRQARDGGPDGRAGNGKPPGLVYQQDKRQEQEGGDRQVPGDPKVAAVGVGGGPVAGCLLLRRD